MKRQTYLERTLEMLDTAPLQMPRIAANSGLPVRWVRAVKSRQLSNPGVNQVEILHEYLKRSQKVWNHPDFTV